MKVKVPTQQPKPMTKRASSTEDRENQMIAMAYDLVEDRLRNGTATSQETTFFLKLGCTKEKLEREKLEQENELLKAKSKAIQDAIDIKELYSQAIDAMKLYQGGSSDA